VIREAKLLGRTWRTSSARPPAQVGALVIPAHSTLTIDAAVTGPGMR
jgi:hypothetical protein